MIPLSRRTLVAGTAAYVAGALACRTASAATETRVALVIGIADYRNAPRLKCPPRDASAIAAELTAVG